MKRIIYLPKRALCEVVLLILVGLVAWRVLPGPLRSGWKSFQALALHKPTLEYRAKEIAVAIENYDYRDQEGWKKQLYSLCNEDGKAFWNAQFEQGFMEGAIKAVTDEVTVKSVTVEERTKQGDFEAASVIVVGKALYHLGEDTGETFTDPFLIKLILLKRPQEEWKLSMFSGRQ